MTTAAYIIVGLFVLIGTAVTAYLGYRANKGSAANEFTKNLMERLDKVEEQVKELQAALTLSQRATIAAVRFIDRLVSWGKAGGVEKMPTPSPELHEYLDPTMWGEAEKNPQTKP